MSDAFNYFARLGVVFPENYQKAAPHTRPPAYEYTCRLCQGSGKTRSYLRRSWVCCYMCNGRGVLRKNRAGRRRYTLSRIRK